MKTCDSDDALNASELDHLKFFDEPQSPNDEGEDSPVEDGSLPPSNDALDNDTDTIHLHQEGEHSATTLVTKTGLRAVPMFKILVI